MLWIYCISIARSLAQHTHTHKRKYKQTIHIGMGRIQWIQDILSLLLRQALCCLKPPSAKRLSRALMYEKLHFIAFDSVHLFEWNSILHNTTRNFTCHPIKWNNSDQKILNEIPTESIHDSTRHRNPAILGRCSNFELQSSFSYFHFHLNVSWSTSTSRVWNVMIWCAASKYSSATLLAFNQSTVWNGSL